MEDKAIRGKATNQWKIQILQQERGHTYRRKGQPRPGKCSCEPASGSRSWWAKDFLLAPAENTISFNSLECHNKMPETQSLEQETLVLSYCSGGRPSEIAYYHGRALVWAFFLSGSWLPSAQSSQESMRKENPKPNLNLTASKRPYLSMSHCGWGGGGRGEEGQSHMWIPRTP